MEIIIDTRMIMEKMHGIARYTFEIVNHLIDNKKTKLYLIVNELNRKSFISKSNNIKYITAKSNFLSIKEQFELPLILNKYKGKALYHSPSFSCSPFINCDTIMTIHDLNHLIFPQYYKKYHKYYYEYIVKPSALKAKKILTGSNFSKNEIVNWLKCREDKVKVIYHGIDKRFMVIEEVDTLMRVKSKYKLPERFLLYVGNTKPHKNVDTLLRALVMVKKDIKLVINGDINEHLGQIIDQLGIVDKVQFIGYVDDDDLPSLYNLADMFIFPSLYEGFGLPPLEAMACGCPVVVSNAASLPEVVEDAGILFNPSNASELSDAVNSIMLSRDLRHNLTQRGLNQARKFTWDKSVEQTLIVYENIFNNINI